MGRACCAVLAAALLLTGCGGGDAGDTANVTATATTPAGPKLTKAGFITKADDACRRTQKKQNQLRKEAEGKQTSELVPTLRKQAVLADSLADELADFGAPPGDGVRVAAFIDSVRQIGVYSKALSDSIEAKHTKPARNLAQRLVRWRQVEHTLGQSYGLKVCARGNSY
jgi:hypothetical protein